MSENGMSTTLIGTQPGELSSNANGDQRQTAKRKADPVSRLNKAILMFELFIIVALELLLILMIVVSTVVLFTLAVQTLRTRTAQIDSVGALLFLVQRSIAGVLIVVLGLEVLETLKAYFRDHHVRLEVILVVATIAAGRHLVQMDFEHASPWNLLGLAAVIASLTLGYFLVKKALFVYPAKAGDDTGQARS